MKWQNMDMFERSMMAVAAALSIAVIGMVLLMYIDFAVCGCGP